MNSTYNIECLLPGGEAKRSERQNKHETINLTPEPLRTAVQEIMELADAKYIGLEKDGIKVKIVRVGTAV